VVRLSGGRTVVVDAKVTLAAYLEAAEATDDDVREQRLVAHAAHLRQHVDRLADKAYWRHVPDSPEFVVLFVPGEAFLAPALDRDPSLLEHAYARRVHIATPTTLVSLLRAVAHAWQQQALADGAREVLAAGRELHARLCTLGGHVDKLGRSLERAVTDFNATIGSLERSVVPAVRRMVELEAVDEALPPPVRVDAVPRRTSVTELDGSDEGRSLASVRDAASG
jgi:DNA recombination protein RmuC